MSTLSDILIQRGFNRIPLVRSGVGHFHTAGLLGEHPVDVLVDTGAASTVVDLSLARNRNFILQPLSRTGGGAGGTTLELYELREVAFTLAGMNPSYRALIAMDLTHVNKSLAMKGESPVQVILGADVLLAHSAVIDYGSSSLFLQISPT